MKTNNYNEYDKIVLYVKKDKAKEIIERYVLFGWEVESQEENSRYEDILDVTLSRPHKIQNKDELQLLQVNMEERLNKRAKIDKHKNSLTTSVGLCLGSVILILMVILALSLSQILVNGLVEKILIGVISVGLIVLEGLILPKIYKYESKKYKTDCGIVDKEIEDICERVKALMGGAYEK